MTRDFLSMLRVRFPAQSYALFREVQSATAYQGKQRADAVAMGLWPSRGLDVIGFEFKSHRGDWLRELKSPEKAEQIFQFCDYWYLVADERTARIDEIPATWGWLRPSDEKLHEAKAAPKLSPNPLDRVFVASLLRSAQKDRDRPEDEIRRKLTDEIREKLSEESDKVLDELRSKITTQRKEHDKEIKRIEDALGVALDSWNLPVETVGFALNLVMIDPGGLLGRLSQARGMLADLLTRIKDADAEVTGLMQAQAVKP